MDTDLSLYFQFDWTGEHELYFERPFSHLFTCATVEYAVDVVDDGVDDGDDCCQIALLLLQQT